MQDWLEWARGPAFRFAFALMVLGLVRVLALNVIGLREVARKAGDRTIPWRAAARATFAWALPRGKMRPSRALFGLLSLFFHAAVISVPLFLAAHIALFERSLGVAWPAMGQGLADTLTLVAVGTALALFVQRVAARASRALSRLQDFALPLLVALPFASGYLAMHPWLVPVAYDTMMFVHVMSGNLLLALIPFSKLSHVVLLPATQLASELGWHLDPQAGGRVAAALGKEEQAL